MSRAFAGLVGRLRRGASRPVVAGWTDGQLLARFAGDRDPDAFAELVRRHGPMVLAVCRRVVTDAHLAEDAFQATFLVLARKAAAVRPPEAVGGWLHGVARKAALEARAVRRRKPEVLVPGIPDRPATGDARRVEPDTLAALDEEVAGLSAPLRAAVVLCELGGVSRQVAAERLGVPEGTLSSRLAAARRVLAARLRARGVVLSAVGLTAALAESARATVPAGLAEAAVRAAKSGVAPHAVSLITTGVMRAMSAGKLRLATAGLVVAAAVTLTGLAPAVPQPPVAGAAAARPQDPRPARESPRKVSPFGAVRWRGEVPEVRVGKAWYELLALDGVEAKAVVGFSRKTYPTLWQKRFEEDLVEVLAGMGQAPGERVALKLRRLDSGKVVTLDRVEMTRDNRWALWEARLDGGPHRVRRDHADKPAAAFAYLTTRAGADAADTPRLTRSQAGEDLDELEWHLENRYSYLKRAGVDHRAALDAVRAGLGDGIPRDVFGVQVAKVLALFGDGHTRVEEDVLPPGYAPFLVGEAGGGLVAFRADRSSFLDADHPFLAALDGVPADRWLAAAARAGPGGSPQFARWQAVRTLRYVQYLRRELGLPTRDVLAVGLKSADGRKERTVEVRVADRRPAYGDWPRTDTRVLDGNVGYLRLARMGGDPQFRRDLVAAMGRVRDTRGLVLDVRGNGGGSRDALLVLFPFFMTAADPPRVANAAAYHLRAGELPDVPEGYLTDRFLHPATSPVWSAADRAAIRAFAAGFEPEWAPPAGAFSGWHYLLLKPRAGAGYYHYNRPVVILTDAGCFSATDVFLGAFKGWRDVTLVGTASGGGSGRAQPLVLHHSGLELRLSSIASYRPDGKLYDGRGVEPDVEAKPVPTDLIGRTDSVLDAALKRLR